MNISSKPISKPISLAVWAIVMLVFSATSNALSLSSSTSRSFFKAFAENQDLACKADDGEMDVNATTDGTTITFLMESPLDAYGAPVSHTCCEVEHDSGLTVADCDIIDPGPGCGICGEFTLDQKVEDPNPIGGLDDVNSNCLQVDVTGGLETYRCVVSKGAPKERWVWHLNKVNDTTYNDFCDSACTDCGVAMGTSDNAKPGEYPPYGIVWQYDQYTKDDEILLANFQGNWCHTGSFCLDDDITCEVKSAKLDLRTGAIANFTIVDVDTVQTFNGNSTSAGGVPTDLLSTSEAGDLLVDPTEIDITSISINGSPVTVLSSSSNSDRNGDGFNDLRTHISQADFQQAMYPDGGCVPDDSVAIIFRGTFTDGSAWAGPTSVKVVCN